MNVSASWFALVYTGGYAGHTGASVTYVGLRPIIYPQAKTVVFGYAWHKRGKYVLPKGKSESGYADLRKGIINRIYRVTETGHLIEKLDSGTITRERRKLKKFKALVENGKMDYQEAESQFRCWKGMFFRYMSKEQRNNTEKYFKAIKEK